MHGLDFQCSETGVLSYVTAYFIHGYSVAQPEGVRKGKKNLARNFEKVEYFCFLGGRFATIHRDIRDIRDIRDRLRFARSSCIIIYYAPRPSEIFLFVKRKVLLAFALPLLVKQKLLLCDPK